MVFSTAGVPSSSYLVDQTASMAAPSSLYRAMPSISVFILQIRPSAVPKYRLSSVPLFQHSQHTAGIFSQ